MTGERERQRVCGCGCGKTERAVIRELMYDNPAHYNRDQAEEIFDSNWAGEYTE